MKDIEKELEEYFKNEPIPQLSIEEKDKIKSKIKSNSNTCEKSQSKNDHRPRILPIFITCLIILIPCIVLPITLTRQKQIYFKDTTAEKLELTIDYVKNIIDEKLPQHTFLYNDYDINFAEGYFIPQSNNLLAMTLDIKSRDLPYTQINICYSLSNQFSYSFHEEYIENSEYTEINNVKVYKKVKDFLLEKNYLYLLDNNTYKIYINMNKDDNNFLKKIL